MSDLENQLEDLFTHDGDSAEDTREVDAKGDLIPARVRTYIYGLLVPVSLLAQFYGIASEQEAALWVGLATAALGGGTAILYRPTR